jgi:RecB family endonuclease NucS
VGADDRVILFKADGALCVHADNDFKPINYNSTKAGPASARLEESPPIGNSLEFVLTGFFEPDP